MLDPVVTHSINAHDFDQSYYFAHYAGSPLIAMGGGKLYNKGNCEGCMNCDTGEWSGLCNLRLYVRDWFKDQWDIFNWIKKDFDTGVPYRINVDWDQAITLPS